MKLKLIAILAVAAMGISLQACQAQGGGEKPAAPNAVAPAAQTGTIENIDGDTYLKMKAENPGLQLLDVRTAAEVAEGFIEDSKHVNVQEELFTENVAKILNKTAPIVVYCKAGSRSARAADLLAKDGFTKIYNLTGGITTWISEGKATVK